MSQSVNGEKLKAKPELIKLFAERDKCFMCKRRFDKPFILPVENPELGKFQPNFNVEVLFHFHETHGIPPEILTEWITGSIYGLNLTMFGVKP